jgi:hypothetical protein
MILQAALCVGLFFVTQNSFGDSFEFRCEKSRGGLARLVESRYIHSFAGFVGGVNGDTVLVDLLEPRLCAAYLVVMTENNRERERKSLDEPRFRCVRTPGNTTHQLEESRYYNEFAEDGSDIVLASYLTKKQCTDSLIRIILGRLVRQQQNSSVFRFRCERELNTDTFTFRKSKYVDPSRLDFLGGDILARRLSQTECLKLVEAKLGALPVDKSNAPRHQMGQQQPSSKRNKQGSARPAY